ncbi:hypothetical protein AAHE18_04G099200 [Arachis hypogaea]|nr:uncharacterized protein DS421_4g118240 [Arachis hypogaea]
MTNHVAVVLSFDGDLHRGWLFRASPLMAKPPALMAVAFPWNRNGLLRLTVDSAEGNANETEKKWRRSHWSRTVVPGSLTAGLSTAAPHIVERERGEMRFGSLFLNGEEEEMTPNFEVDLL